MLKGAEKQAAAAVSNGFGFGVRTATKASMDYIFVRAE